MDTIINDDYAAIAQVLRRYYDGLFNSDPSLLQQTFHPDARYVTASSGELLQLNMEAYLPIVADRASPASLGEPYAYAPESIQFAGPVTASVRMHSSMLGKRFIDFLSLIKVDDEWRIISKVFHYELQEPAPTDKGA